MNKLGALWRAARRDKQTTQSVVDFVFGQVRSEEPDNGGSNERGTDRNTHPFQRPQKCPFDVEGGSYDATEKAGDKLIIDAAYVSERLGELVEDEDLSRFIL